MSTTDQQPQTQQPAPQPPSTDPMLLLVVGIVIVGVLVGTGYLCVVHRSLAGPIGAVGAVASALAAAFGVALALRRR